MPEAWPPGLLMAVGAMLIGMLRGSARAAVVLILPVLALSAVWQVPDGVGATAEFLGRVIELAEGSPVRRLFATIFALMAFAGGLFSFRHAPRQELAAATLYAAAASGVCCAGH